MLQRVGIIGGGQLAWMMADAAAKLGIDLIVQTPEKTDPAVAIASETILAPIADAKATAQLAARSDVITFENEFVDLPALTRLAAQGVCFRPALTALEPLLDKYHQRSYLKQLGLPTPDFTAMTIAEVQTLAAPDYPLVLKTRRHGYDGQGTFIVKTAADLDSLVGRLADVPLILEEFVPFERELAVMAARSVDGTIVVYPVVETEQKNQVCHRVFAPAIVDEAVVNQVTTIAERLLTNLQVVGILGIELFLTQSGDVLVNEIAPRTHNSGHYTLDACDTSQFEQQLRAVCGLPLGSPALRCRGAVMVNLLGYETSYRDYQAQRDRLAAIPQAHVHWYGKMEARPGRKLGHVTVLLDDETLQDPSQLQERELAIAQHIESIWYGK
ncbi:5-(carboxyamino)imidazole ribonucleotide synthase [Leptodesmis sichuanensis]|jgi:5-(carboxyamino)imidazole ribonucleotide synthase|uniref:5-(carboxyamino)imidazole ribonucleotide synthase n=1 Tax=Leptodesmis sichuanensis TaxID=2906798 RepID=UPI001F47A08C|nr:5-(carboxyamino)imidazole ribonucleotide synthase [Leptodesmis sichuanensis]UIE37368.1 5-(carboxyamino)imidazole ribonucleotide synthase [Leptodesmis sichuanensis A121]